MSIAGKQTFQCIHLADFLRELAKKVKRNSASWDNLQRMYIPPAEAPDVPKGCPLRTNILYKHVQRILTDDTAIMAETGDSWFNCQKLKLPDGCGFEFQASTAGNPGSGRRNADCKLHCLISRVPVQPY